MRVVGSHGWHATSHNFSTILGWAAPFSSSFGSPSTGLPSGCLASRTSGASWHWSFPAVLLYHLLDYGYWIYYAKIPGFPFQPTLLVFLPAVHMGSHAIDPAFQNQLEMKGTHRGRSVGRHPIRQQLVMAFIRLALQLQLPSFHPDHLRQELPSRAADVPRLG